VEEMAELVRDHVLAKFPGVSSYTCEVAGKAADVV